MSGNHLRLVGSTKKAFQLRKCKLVTLHYAIEQIEPILEKYMEKKDILKVTFDFRKRHVLALEPIEYGERDMWIRMWLDNEFSSEKLVQKMKYNYQWVQYVSISDFLSGIEAWLQKERKLNKNPRQI